MSNVLDRFGDATSFRRFLEIVSCLYLVFAASLHAEVTVLKNFTLIDGTGRGPLVHAAMIIDSGRVRWVGPAAQLTAPASAEIIDLPGKYVMPGIINLHGHIGNTVDL